MLDTLCNTCISSFGIILQLLEAENIPEALVTSLSLLLWVGTAISHFKELGDTPTSHCLVVFHSEGDFRKLDCGLGFSMGEEVKVKEQTVGTEEKS